MRAYRATAATRRMVTKELDLLVATHDASGSSAIADALRFAQGRDDNATRADVEALAALLVKVSEFAVSAGDSLESLDINPVLVRPEGRGAVALDALVIGRVSGREVNNKESV